MHQLAEEWQLLDPGDLAEEQLVRQATQQRKQLHLGHLVPSRRGGGKGVNIRRTGPKDVSRTLRHKRASASHSPVLDQHGRGQRGEVLGRHQLQHQGVGLGVEAAGLRGQEARLGGVAEEELSSQEINMFWST